MFIYFYYIFYKIASFLLFNGLGIGDWGLGPSPNPQSPIHNPHTPLSKLINIYLFYLIYLKICKNINYYLSFKT